MTVDEFKSATASACELRDEWVLVGSGVLEPAAAALAYADAGLTMEAFIDAHAAAAMAHILSHRADELIDATDIADACGMPIAAILHASETLATTRHDGSAAARRIASRAKQRDLMRAMDAAQTELQGEHIDPQTLRRLIEAAADADEDHAGRVLRIVDGSVAARRNIPPPDTVLEGVFETRDKVDVVAPSKCRKSWFTIGLALHIAAGRPFLGIHVPSPRRVLYVNLEIKADDFDRRLQRSCDAYGISPDALGDRLGIMHSRGLGPDVRSGIISIARRFRAAVVVIDPQYKLLRPEEDENTGSGVSEVLRLKDCIAEESGAAVVAVMHDGKGMSGDRDIRDRGAGSSWTARDFDARITLTPHAEDPDNMAVVSVMCRNHPPRPDFSVEFADFAFRPVEDAPATPETSQTREDRRRNESKERNATAAETSVFRFLRAERTPISFSSLSTRMVAGGILGTEWQVRKALKTLVQKGMVNVEKGSQKNTSVFSVCEQFVSSQTDPENARAARQFVSL